MSDMCGACLMAIDLMLTLRCDREAGHQRRRLLRLWAEADARTEVVTP